MSAFAEEEESEGVEITTYCSQTEPACEKGKSFLYVCVRVVCVGAVRSVTERTWLVYFAPSSVCPPVCYLPTMHLRVLVTATIRDGVWSCRLRLKQTSVEYERNSLHVPTCTKPSPGLRIQSTTDMYYGHSWQRCPALEW